MTAPARLRQADLARTLKALKSADLHSARVRIDPDGTIDIVIGMQADVAPINPLDRLLDNAA